LRRYGRRFAGSFSYRYGFSWLTPPPAGLSFIQGFGSYGGVELFEEDV
jgi:hypothetical protein